MTMSRAVSIARASFAAVCGAAAVLAAAETKPAELSASKALTQTVNAVVGLRSTVRANAQTAQTLGRERQGSGVVIDRDGLILTIGYLLVEADTVEVATDDGLKAPANVVAYDQATGFGLLRSVLPLNIEPAFIGDSSRLKEDQPMLTVAGGDDGSVTATVLVSKRPFAGNREYLLDEALFTSPPRIDHSGAALVNADGELVGIGSLFVTNATGEQARVPGNMFVPIDLLKPILDELKRDGTSRASRRPWLGINSQELDGRVRVIRVSRGSPAAAAGIEPGDLVLEINGVKVTSLDGMYRELWKSPRPDAEVQIKLLKGSDVTTLKVRPDERRRFLTVPQGI